MPSDKVVSYVQAMRDFFYREGKDNLVSFYLNELHALTPEDKKFFRNELTRIGYELKD